MALRPPISRRGWSLLVELTAEAVLPNRYLALALVFVSSLNSCTYRVSRHAPKLAIQGVPEEGVDRPLEYENHPERDDVDKLVVEYAIAVTNKWNQIGDETLDRLNRRFTEAQIVELTWRTARCGPSIASITFRASPCARPPNDRYGFQ